MARRCEHCKHWVDTVFKGESASGWGVWYGNCHNPDPIGRDRHSLMPACERFEAGMHPNSLNAMTANVQHEGRPEGVPLDAVVGRQTHGGNDGNLG